MKLVWQRSNTPAELHSMLEILNCEYLVYENGNGTKLVFQKVESDTLYVNVVKQNNKVKISYSSIAAAARGIGMVSAGLQGENKATFETVGIMVDVSRNMVMTVEHFKKWLRRLALSGGNIVFIYAEDTYKMEGEPFFGFGRGSYTLAELQELDRYAKKHLCQNCGYENDTTFDNIKGVCTDCGATIQEGSKLCADCKQKRRNKAKDWLEITVKAVGVAAVAVGAVCSAISETDSTSDYIPLPGVTDLRAKYTSEWLKAASLDELEMERLKVQNIFFNMDSETPSYWDVHALITEFDEAIKNFNV